MANNKGYPNGIEEWKKSSVEWLFAEGLLTDEAWKGKIEEPLPLWAQALIYQRLYQKLMKAGDKNDRKANF